jgi:hypothetical protein
MDGGNSPPLKRYREYVARYRRISIQPWFAGIAAIVGAIAGVLGAVWTEHIRLAFPFDCCGGQIDTYALRFWIAVIAFGVMFGSNFWAQSSVLDEHTDRLAAGLNTLRDSSKTLEEQIQTFPPKYFLDGFEALLVGCYPVAVKASQPAATPKEMREGIISVLSSIAYMAKLFDAGPKATEYSANIMVFRDFANLSRDQIADFEGRAKFSFRAGTGGGGWSGVLELIPNLAVFLRGDRIFLDGEARLPRFVLEVPLPKYRLDYGKSTVIPGAPEAFCEGAYTFVHDTHEMADECRRNRAIRQSVLVEMDRYFREEEGRDIRSFVSIPLQRPVDGEVAAGDQERLRIGVINIHCGVTNMLRARGAGLFVPMTAAHKLLISRLVENFLRNETDMSI